MKDTKPGCISALEDWVGTPLPYCHVVAKILLFLYDYSNMDFEEAFILFLISVLSGQQTLELVPPHTIPKKETHN